MEQLLSLFPSQADIQMWSEEAGGSAWLLLSFWGTLSVVITPLNFSLFGLATGLAYGTFGGFFINWICKIVGTSISFLLAHKFGRAVLQKLIPAQQLKKFDYLIENEKTMLLYIILCFIPFTPSDTLAYLVGMSKVKYKNFLGLSILANSGTAFGLAYLGSGGGLKNPFFLAGLVIVLCASLYYIHLHRKKYSLHS